MVERQVRMDTYMIKDLLMSQAERMMKLAEKLQDEGEHLNENELQMIRVAIYPAIQEIQDVIASSFLMGNSAWCNDEISKLREMIKEAF